MAYTKIIKVKSNLNLCLDYTSNPKKTERRSAEDLNRLLSYTQSNDKTEHQLYVSGFNCIPQNAYEIMMETKQRWRKPVKDGNILAYHIIQSFSPGEATPDQVHQIGCEFAQRFLADRFECTVSTHLDRGHLHNHIVVNSVSYADGKMFRSDFNTYYKGIRETSDELCRENRLSVIETDGKGKSYDEWLSGQAGKPTIRGMVRKDVEQANAGRFTSSEQENSVPYAECRKNQGVSHWAQLPHPQGECNPIFAERNTRRLQHCQCGNRQCGIRGTYPLSYRCCQYRWIAGKEQRNENESYRLSYAKTRILLCGSESAHG